MASQTKPTRASQLLQELKAAIGAANGKGWLALTENNIEAVMQQFNATTVAELLAQQAAFADAQCFFTKSSDPAEGQKGCQYAAIPSVMSAVPAGVTAIDWSGKINSPYAEGICRRCVKDGIVFWLSDGKLDPVKYPEGVYYRIAKATDKPKAYVNKALAKKPS